MCDSLSAVLVFGELSDGGDGELGTWALWRPPPAKKGRQALERMRLRGAASLRALAGTRAKQVGLARFFRNPRVKVEEILSAAAGRTAVAAAGRHVLLIEDTSEINYQAKAGRKRGLGRVGNGSDVGLFVHPALALDAQDGAVLGLAGATIWQRRARKRPDYQARPIETKESYRWLSTIAAARSRLEAATLVTVVADREADIFELLARLPDARTHALVRAAHDRALDDGGRLLSALAAQPEAGRIDFELPARAGRPARSIRLAVRFRATQLRQPRRGADRRDAPSVALNAVEVSEIDPPSKAQAVVWRLLTTHQVDTLADAVHLVELYRRRWAVEQLFRTLKSQALDIEASFLEDAAALERLAATGLVAATMVMQLVHGRADAGRRHPAGRVFGPEQIAVLHALTRKLQGSTVKQQNPHPPETLAWAAWHIARLGGWMGYASERPPGPITFSRGLTRFDAMAQGFALLQHSTLRHRMCANARQGGREYLASQTQIERNRDALLCPLVGPHGVAQPGREQDEHPRARADQFAGAGRLPARHGEAQHWRVHRRCHAARVADLEFAAERGIAGDAAIVDIVGAGPEAAGMGVELVAVAAAIDVRPGIHLPGDGDRFARAVRCGAARQVARRRQHRVGRRAAPIGQVPGRLPAAQVGMLDRGMRGRPRPDRRGERRIDDRRFGDIRHDHRRGEIGPELRLGDGRHVTSNASALARIASGQGAPRRALVSNSRLTTCAVAINSPVSTSNILWHSVMVLLLTEVMPVRTAR